MDQFPVLKIFFLTFPAGNFAENGQILYPVLNIFRPEKSQWISNSYSNIYLQIAEIVFEHLHESINQFLSIILSIFINAIQVCDLL